MKNQSNCPPKSLEPTNPKVRQKADEMTVFYEFLLDKVTSCTDAAKKLNIPQKHLTWYKRAFEKAGKLQVVKKHRCPHTRKWVQFITTDPAKFPQPSQYKIPFSQP